MKPSLIIDRELAQAVVNYLSGRPYVEVAPLIDKLLRLSPLESTDAKTGTEKDRVPKVVK